MFPGSGGGGGGRGVFFFFSPLLWRTLVRCFCWMTKG